MISPVDDPRRRYARALGWLGGKLQDLGNFLVVWSWGK